LTPRLTDEAIARRRRLYALGGTVLLPGVRYMTALSDAVFFKVRCEEN
jgi:hypothetical protein